MNIKILRKSALINKTGRSKSSLHNDIHKGVMIPPVKLGERMVGWPEHEIDAILAARIAGMDDEQIKNLVSNLEAKRKSFAHRVWTE